MRQSTLSKIYLLLICILASSLQLSADPKPHTGEKQKTMLILNSYNEQSLWSRTLVAPITLFVANDDNIHAELFSLNNILITDSTSYNIVKNNLFETFANHKPDYLVIIGNLAFSMRDDIKAQWGDLPILLITRDLSLAPTDYFFSGFDKSAPNVSYPSIAELRPDFNFTAIYVPDLYQPTIDMMMKLIPKMNEFVFFSDGIFLNRNLARDIQMYLYDKYPGVKFKWVQASAEHPDDLQYYFVHDLPHTGMLISTWYYEKKNAFGYSSLVSGDINLLNSSVNPIFSLRKSFMEIGSIGGVYANEDSLNNQINKVLTAMVNGKSMRDIKFYSNKHDYITVLDYEKLKEYELSEKDCPKDVIFVDKPATFWEKYGWQMVSLIVIFTLIVMMLVRYSVTQRRQINILARHRKFVDKMPMPFSKATIIYDDKDNVVNIKYKLYNKAFEKILSDNCYQVDPYLIFPNEYIAEKTAELLEGHDSISFKYHFDKTNTDYIFTLCFVEGRKVNEKELVEEIDIFAIDITNQQRTEIELKELGQKLDRTLNVAKLIPWELNLKTHELVFDAYSMFDRGPLTISEDGKSKYKSSKMTSYAYTTLVHPDDREKVNEIGEKINKGEIDDFKMEYRLSTARKGQMIYEWVEVNGAVTKYDEDGKPMIVTGSMCVITERKKQEVALIEAREKATESDKLKSAFLANMSHEIRTPLNAIVGFSSLMCETDDLEKRREFSSIINQNNDMLLALINDVLDLAKIESNSLEVCYSTVNLNALMATINDTVKMRVHNGVLLNMVVGQPRCVVSTDGNRVSQVMINMLTNAAKFTTKGSITFGYDIIDNKELYFYVKDTGIGVSIENQKRLFKRFDKINNFMQGNGLGLSICKSIVEMMGGTIGMKSRGEGKGSTFWFSIPYNPVTQTAADTSKQQTALVDDIPTRVKHQPSAPVTTAIKTPESQDSATNPTVQTVSATPEEKAPESGKQKVILVAEDIEGNFMLLQHIIPKEYKILHAWDGNEAIDLYSVNHPDIVLMDISMPTVDGYQATEAIRKINATVPIIAVTAYAYASDRKRILRSGFNDYLSKPVIREDLLEVLKRYLG